MGPHIGYSIITLKVQVPYNHILTRNLYYNYYCPNPKYQIIGYMDPLGKIPIYYLLKGDYIRGEHEEGLVGTDIHSPVLQEPEPFT